MIVVVYSQILTDNPSDQKSRWLSSDNRLPQVREIFTPHSSNTGLHVKYIVALCLAMVYHIIMCVRVCVSSEKTCSIQFLTLKLEQHAIVRSILFGKFDKSHPCNLRKFRIYGGMDPDHLHLMIEE